MDQPDSPHLTSPLERFILDSLGIVDRLRLSFVTGLGHAHMEAGIHRTSTSAEVWSGNLQISTTGIGNKSVGKSGELVSDDGLAWVQRIARLLPLIANPGQGQNGSVRITCEIGMQGTVLTVSSSQIANSSDLYQEIVREAFSLIEKPALSTASPSAGDDSLEIAWDKLANVSQHPNVRDNPHASSKESCQITIGGVRLRLPYGIEWSPKKSVISKELLRRAVTIIAKIQGRQFGLFSKSGEYQAPGNRYTPTIECMEDLEYLRKLIREVKHSSPEAKCLDQ